MKALLTFILLGLFTSQALADQPFLDNDTCIAFLKGQLEANGKDPEGFTFVLINSGFVQGGAFNSYLVKSTKDGSEGIVTVGMAVATKGTPDKEGEPKDKDADPKIGVSF